MRQDGKVQDFVSEIRRRDGSRAWISENARSVADETGGFLFYEGTVEDVTAPHQTEAALRRALQDSEEAARSKAAFLASMSHELKTPLNAIIGFSDLMRQGMFGELSERYATYTGHIYDNGKSLLAMISDVLDLTRAEGQLLDLEEETFPLGTIVEDAIAATGTAKDMPELRAEIPPDLPWLRGDPRRIRQIVSHVISNAMKFTTCKGRVTISSRRDDAGMLVLSISDTGIGMAPDRIPHALEPFRQLDNHVTARRFEGVGVGLPLASALLRLHQGKLHIHSVPGEGTTVDISFPPSRLVEAHKALVA
jgi:signal transduction histidine kinase